MTGMVGYYFDDAIPHFERSTGYSLTSQETIAKIFEEHQPKYVIHMAAMTDVRAAESNPNDCFLINTIATYWIAFYSRKYKSKLVFISTVDIYNGQQKEPYDNDEVPDPIVVYGHSKLAAEAIIQKLTPDALILRCGWMFGGIGRDKKFISYIMKFIREGQAVHAVNDVLGTPTYAKHLVNAIPLLLNEKGVLNICSLNKCTRFDQAKLVCELMGYYEAKAVSSGAFPNYRTLKNACMKPTARVPYIAWEAALTDYINDWRAHEKI